MKKNTLIKKLNQIKPSLEKFGVKRLGLFGSYVRNESKKDSDIDFLVEFKEGKKNYNNFIHLVFFLEDFFCKKVDLLTLSSLSPYIRPYILAEVEYIEI